MKRKDNKRTGLRKAENGDEILLGDRQESLGTFLIQSVIMQNNTVHINALSIPTVELQNMKHAAVKLNMVKNVRYDQGDGRDTHVYYFSSIRVFQGLWNVGWMIISKNCHAYDLIFLRCQQQRSNQNSYTWRSRYVWPRSHDVPEDGYILRQPIARHTPQAGNMTLVNMDPRESFTKSRAKDRRASRQKSTYEAMPSFTSPENINSVIQWHTFVCMFSDERIFCLHTVQSWGAIACTVYSLFVIDTNPDIMVWGGMSHNWHSPLNLVERTLNKLDPKYLLRRSDTNNINRIAV